MSRLSRLTVSRLSILTDVVASTVVASTVDRSTVDEPIAGVGVVVVARVGHPSIIVVVACSACSDNDTTLSIVGLSGNNKGKSNSSPRNTWSPNRRSPIRLGKSGCVSGGSVRRRGVRGCFGSPNRRSPIRGGG